MKNVQNRKANQYIVIIMNYRICIENVTDLVNVMNWFYLKKTWNNLLLQRLFCFIIKEIFFLCLDIGFYPFSSNFGKIFKNLFFKIIKWNEYFASEVVGT